MLNAFTKLIASTLVNMFFMAEMSEVFETMKYLNSMFCSQVFLVNLFQMPVIEEELKTKMVEEHYFMSAKDF